MLRLLLWLLLFVARIATASSAKIHVQSIVEGDPLLRQGEPLQQSALTDMCCGQPGFSSCLASVFALFVGNDLPLHLLAGNDLPRWQQNDLPRWQRPSSVGNDLLWQRRPGPRVVAVVRILAEGLLTLRLAPLAGRPLLLLAHGSASAYLLADRPFERRSWFALARRGLLPLWACWRPL